MIFDYDKGRGDPTSTKASNISPYLFNGDDAVVYQRRTAICPVLPIVYGSMPNDAGNLIVKAEAHESLLSESPEIERYLRPFYGSHEYINSIERWCIWLVDADPGVIRNIPDLMKRIEGVRTHRLSSTRLTTRDLARTPTLFGEIRQPSTSYLLIPKNPSHKRPYLTVGFMDASVIASDQCLIVPSAGLYEFGVISSKMHIAWVATIGGRLKTDYRYSNTVVYNNYPWPLDVNEAKPGGSRKAAAQAVLDARDVHPDASLADLYDPLAMPANLAKAHANLDRGR